MTATAGKATRQRFPMRQSVGNCCFSRANAEDVSNATADGISVAESGLREARIRGTLFSIPRFPLTLRQIAGFMNKHKGRRTSESSVRLRYGTSPSRRLICTTGAFATLEAVVDHYAAGGRMDHPNKSRILRRFSMT